MEDIKKIREVQYQNIIEGHISSKICHSKTKCSECEIIQELKLEHLFDDGRYSHKGVFYTLNEERDIWEGNEHITQHHHYVNNHLMKFISAYFLLSCDTQVKPDIIFYYQCGHMFRFITEETHVEVLNPKIVTLDLLELYENTSQYKYLHGRPCVSNLIFNTESQPRILTNEHSAFVIDNRLFIKKYHSIKTQLMIGNDDDDDHIFSIIKLPLNYARYTDKYYEYLWIIEFYCYMISLYRCPGKQASNSWQELFKNLWDTSEYISVMRDIEDLDVDHSFENIHKIVSKYKLRKNIHELVHKYIKV